MTLKCKSQFKKTNKKKQWDMVPARHYLGQSAESRPEGNSGSASPGPSPAHAESMHKVLRAHNNGKNIKWQSTA